MSKKSKRQKHKQPVRDIKEEAEIPEGYTTQLHHDLKDTLVQVGNELFKLVPAGTTMRDVLKIKEFKKVPHVRHLNPIKERTSEEQRLKNEDAETMHDLSLQVARGSDKVTSLKKAMTLGKDVPKEIERLLKEKEEAKKKGDEKAAREIRRALRKLDYKRYLQEGAKK